MNNERNIVILILTTPIVFVAFFIAGICISICGICWGGEFVVNNKKKWWSTGGRIE